MRQECRRVVELMYHVLTQIPDLALMTPYRHDARLSLGTRPQTPYSSLPSTPASMLPSAWLRCAFNRPPRVQP